MAGLSQRTLGQLGMDAEARQRQQFLQGGLLQAVGGPRGCEGHQMTGSPALHATFQLHLATGAVGVVDEIKDIFGTFFRGTRHFGDVQVKHGFLGRQNSSSAHGTVAQGLKQYYQKGYSIASASFIKERTMKLLVNFLYKLVSVKWIHMMSTKEYLINSKTIHNVPQNYISVILDYD